MCAFAGVSMNGVAMRHVTVNKGQENTKGSREGRFPAGKHSLRLRVELKRVLC